jgi:hypothetical protein
VSPSRAIKKPPAMRVDIYLASGKTLVELAMEKVYNGKEFEKKKG